MTRLPVVVTGPPGAGKSTAAGMLVEQWSPATGRLARGGIIVVHEGVVGPWFVADFLAAAGLDAVHYAVLLPGEEVCLDRIRSRPGHGFTDLDAARHLYGDFATAVAHLDARHVVAVRDDEDAAAVASRVAAAVTAGTLLTR